MNEENRNCWLYEKCNHVDCDCFCLRHYKTGVLFDKAMVSERQRKRISLVLDSDERDRECFDYLSKVESNILNFVETGGNIYIHSTNTGNGKTSWALRLIQAYIGRIWARSQLTCRALFIHVPRLLLELKNNISEKSEYANYVKDNVLNADLVVWDEVGTKGLTPFEHEHILNFIDSRIDSGKANVYTSNLTNEELHNALGDRLYSRIVLNSDDVEFVGADKRALQLG